MLNHNMHNLASTILKSFGIDTDTKTIRQIYQCLKEEDYTNIIVLHINGFSKEDILDTLSPDCYLYQNLLMEIGNSNNNRNDFLSFNLLDKINSVDNKYAYGVFPDGILPYKNREEAYNRIVSLSKSNVTKLIYSYIDVSDESNNLIKSIDNEVQELVNNVSNALVIVTIEKNGFDNLLLCVVKKKKPSDYIRKIESGDFAFYREMMMKIQKYRGKIRPDIFNRGAVFSLNQFKNLCFSGNDYIGLSYVSNGEVLGMIIAERYSYGNDYYFSSTSILRILSIYVKEGFRRNKIGTKLINEMNNQAKKCHVKRVEILCYSVEEDYSNFIKSFNMNTVSTIYEFDVK